MIELEGVQQVYRSRQGQVHALRGVDLSVAPGQVYGVIGRSGAGKSSLVRTINLLNRPVAGRVRVQGRDLTALGQAELRQARQGIGMVFQHFNLLSSRTVAANVALPLELAGAGRAEIDSRVAELLDLVGLAALKDRYPAHISGGQKQRVGIARALAARPGVLLCDEATSALDPQTTRSILALLRQINRDFGVTLVLITHQMQVIKQVADEVAVMEAGQIVERGPVAEVFTQARHAVTRGLIDEVLPQQLPVSVVARIRQLMGAGAGHDSRVLRIAFAGAEATDPPLLAQLVRQFGIDFSLLHGQIDEIQGRPFGSLAIHVRGAAHSVQAAIDHLSRCGVHVRDAHWQAEAVHA